MDVQESRTVERDRGVKEYYVRVLGAGHPDTLKDIAKLASTYSSQGWGTEAEDLWVEIKERYCSVLGSEHPYTLGSMGHHAFMAGGRKQRSCRLR